MCLKYMVSNDLVVSLLVIIGRGRKYFISNFVSPLSQAPMKLFPSVRLKIYIENTIAIKKLIVFSSKKPVEVVLECNFSFLFNFEWG